jgi:hypothetical protein
LDSNDSIDSAAMHNIRISLVKFTSSRKRKTEMAAAQESILVEPFFGYARGDGTPYRPTTLNDHFKTGH